MSQMLKALLLVILLSACAQRENPVDTVTTILELMEHKDFESLEKFIPFLSDLSTQDRLLLAESFMPYFSTQLQISQKQQSLNSYIVLVSSNNPKTPTLIMTMIKGKDVDWILSDQIRYKQSFDFIPLDKK